MLPWSRMGPPNDADGEPGTDNEDITEEELITLKTRRHIIAEQSVEKRRRAAEGRVTEQNAASVHAERRGANGACIELGTGEQPHLPIHESPRQVVMCGGYDG